jgi:phosphoribosyl-dephospho-CoA transferase
MKYTKHLKTKEIINKNIDKLLSLMNLQEWEINILYIDGASDSGSEIAMDTSTDISYLKADIRVFDVTHKCKRQEIIEILTHELSHIITEPLYSLSIKNVAPQLHPVVEEQREQQTERIARIVGKLYAKN